MLLTPKKSKGPAVVTARSVQAARVSASVLRVAEQMSLSYPGHFVRRQPGRRSRLCAYQDELYQYLDGNQAGHYAAVAKAVVAAPLVVAHLPARAS